MEGEGEEDNKFDDHTYLAPPQYGRQRGERNFNMDRQSLTVQVEC
jgi:hypothetical protein